MCEKMLEWSIRATSAIGGDLLELYCGEQPGARGAVHSNNGCEQAMATSRWPLHPISVGCWELRWMRLVLAH